MLNNYIQDKQKPGDDDASDLDYQMQAPQNVLILSVVRDAVFNDVSGDATIAAGLTITPNSTVEIHNDCG